MANVRHIGKWIIGDTLGVGGFSKVKLGIDSETGQKAALKILPRSRAQSGSAISQVEAEVRAMSRISHPNVIQLHDVDFAARYPKGDGTTVEVLLVVLEFASGGEFFDFLSYTGKYSEDIARDFFQQLIGGLEACHTQAIAHRDIKPENLLLDDQFRLKIADFGFSRVLSSSNDQMQTECGTRGYMAPEIIDHQRYTMKTDIFAAGVVLFIMLAGFPPFQIAKRTDWWFHKLIVNRAPLFWQAHCRTAEFSDSAKDLIEKLLAPNPEDRATIEDIKQHPWFTKPSGLTAQQIHQYLYEQHQAMGRQIQLPPGAQEARREEIFLDLSDRKLRVDERKEAEKSAAMAARAADNHTFRSLEHEQEETDLYGSSEEPTLNAQDSELPSAIPNMQYMRRRVGGGAAASSSSGDAAATIDQATPTIASNPPEVYEQDKHVQSYTQFLSNAAPHDIYNRIRRVSQALKPSPVINDRVEKHKIRVTLDGNLQFVAKIYTHADLDSVYQVVFSRRKGDPIAYRKLFEKLQGSLGDLIYSAQASADGDDDEEEMPS